MIHFYILFNTFQSLKCQRLPKMATFGLKMAILDLKMAMDVFKNIFIWSAAKSKAKSWIYGFLIKKFIWKHFKQNNNLVFSFKKLTLWFRFWSHTTSQCWGATFVLPKTASEVLLYDIVVMARDRNWNPGLSFLKEKPYFRCCRKKI